MQVAKQIAFTLFQIAYDGQVRWDLEEQPSLGRVIVAAVEPTRVHFRSESGCVRDDLPAAKNPPEFELEQFLHDGYAAQSALVPVTKTQDQLPQGTPEQLRAGHGLAQIARQPAKTLSRGQNRRHDE